MKRLWCRLGLHVWETMINEGEQYVRCKHCRKYGGSVPSPSLFAMRWRD